MSPSFVEIESRFAFYVDTANAWLIEHQLLVAAQLVLLTLAFFWYLDAAQPTPKPRGPLTKPQLKPAPDYKNPMQAPDVVLDPPKDTPFTVQELAEFNGLTPGRPIYVAMKGLIFDGQSPSPPRAGSQLVVSAKKEMYGPGAGYNVSLSSRPFESDRSQVFAGKDGSRGLGRSSLKPEDAVSDYSVLTAEELVVLNDWVKYFTKVRPRLVRSSADSSCAAVQHHRQAGPVDPLHSNHFSMLGSGPKGTILVGLIWGCDV